MIAATGVLHHPKYPDIEGLDDFAGAMLPQRPLGSRRRRSTASASASSAPARPRCRSSARSSTGSAHLDALPAHRAVGAAAGEPRVHRRRRRPRSARTRERLHRAARQPVAGVRRVRERGRRRRVARERTGSRPRASPTSRTASRTRSCASGSGPTYRAACKRLIISPELLRGDPGAERRAGHRGHRAHRARRACARRTACCTSSTCWCSRPASTPTRSCGRCRSSVATA